MTREIFQVRDARIVPAPDAPIVTADAARRIDALCAERYHIPSLLLMEQAAAGLEVVAVEMLAGAGGPVVILCGPGSNGGDGFALARRLHNRGLEVGLRVAPGAGSSGDSQINRRIAEQMGIPIAAGVPGAGEHARLIVDALFGTGLGRPVEGPAAELIAWANGARRAGARTLAVDVPSGISAESGEALGQAIEADTTVTFVGVKPGLLRAAGAACAGRIVIAPIGAPRELEREVLGG
ncbi:MAG: NAD(P)H-hydrate epimerase [Phycisphaerales bacterium JB039]